MGEDNARRFHTMEGASRPLREIGGTMRLRDFQRAEESVIAHCPVRHLCPVGLVCGRGDEEGKLMPAVIAFDKGDLLWTDHRYERHVFIVREGVLSCMAHVDPDGEAPFTLYGAGIGVGIADLYVPHTDASTYHLHAIVPGRICSLPSKALKRHLEALGGDGQQKILAASLYNQSTGALFQSMISSRPLLCQRLAMLLLCLQALAARGGTRIDELRVTHDELASRVLSDRASVTRALHQMEAQGLVELGYRSVLVTEKLRRSNPEWIALCETFSCVG